MRPSYRLFEIPRRAATAVAVAGLAWCLASGSAQANAIITNPLSLFEIVVDGLFSGGFSGGSVVGEWSDVTPQGFLAPPVSDPTDPELDPFGNSFRGLRRQDDLALANAQLYAAVAPGAALIGSDLYLMYSFLDRTNPVFGIGEFIADKRFPIVIGGVTVPIQIQVRGAAATDSGAKAIVEDLVGDGNGIARVDSFFNFQILDPAGNPLDPSSLGIKVAVGFGPSTSAPTRHMNIELEVPLLITTEFPSFLVSNGGVFPDDGLLGVYSPASAFWSADLANDLVDPPFSFSEFTINPDGSTTLNSSSVPAVPVSEPATLAIFAFGLAGLGFMRRRRRWAA